MHLNAGRDQPFARAAARQQADHQRRISRRLLADRQIGEHRLSTAGAEAGYDVHYLARASTAGIFVCAIRQSSSTSNTHGAPGRKGRAKRWRSKMPEMAQRWHNFLTVLTSSSAQAEGDRPGVSDRSHYRNAPTDRGISHSECSVAGDVGRPDPDN
jgi:hypothetical protein